MSGDDAVHAIEDRRRNVCERARRRTRKRHQLQEAHDPGSVADNGSVLEDEAPRCEELIVGEVGEESSGFGVGERKDRELLFGVEEDDDTRRPAAEASATVIQEDRPSNLGAHYWLAR